MNIEQVRIQLVNKLEEHFVVHSVKSTVISGARLRGPSMKSKIVLGFEFIVNHINPGRFHVFAIERDGEIKFTRPKQGLASFLIAEIREHDFYFHISDDLKSNNNFIGRFIDTWLGYAGCDKMSAVFNKAAGNSPNAPDFCFGYKITQFHRMTKTFDAEFELLVDQGNGYQTYGGKFISGELSEIRSPEGELVDINELFSSVTAHNVELTNALGVTK